MKFSEIDRGYGVEVKVTGQSFLILELSDKLSLGGYQVGNMVSDFRPSYFITNAPMDVIEGVLERLETK